MTENIKQIIETIGISNLISIVLFIISIFIAFYFYFKSFYRIVYSTEWICKRKNDLVDWKNKDNKFSTRLLFYNNGRKTITSDEIKKFNIKATGEIFEFFVLQGINQFEIEKGENELDIKINFLDKSKYFVLEINHSGNLKIDGKISETGSFLQTETQTWLIINFIFFIFIFLNFGYNFFIYLSPDEPEKTNMKMIGLNFVLFILLTSFIRYIHRIFFIPDSVISKYLHTTDKWNKEFKNYYD